MQQKSQDIRGTRSSFQSLLIYGFASLCGVYLVLNMYGPALHGPFVFDDLFLAYTQPHATTKPLAEWCGLRPVLGLSFWASFQLWGLDTFPYHVVNVLLHCGSAILLFLIVRRILEWAGTTGERATVLAGFSALIFLSHPIQTEAVAYIASRSENLSGLFVFGALCVFVCRRSREVSWGISTVVLGLFACAIATKEHAIALPAVLLLTDYFWNPGFGVSGIRKNWRLYIPLMVGACAAALFVWTYVSRDPMIGFHIQGLSWYEYFLTESRAYFSYIGLFLLPVGQNVDHDFDISRSMLDHGAIVAIGCLGLLISAAVLLRRRFPLAAYGFFVFLVLLAPTSSFIPIHDVFVERRLYLPFIGMLLIALEWLRRLAVPPRTLALGLACVVLVCGYMTWRRAHVWASVTSLWEDSAAKSPGKPRARIGLGNAYMHEQRCSDAAREYEAAYRLGHPDFTLKYNLGAAYECLHQPERATEYLHEAIAENPNAAPSYALLGMVHAEKKEWKKGLDSLVHAEQLDPGYAPAHAYHGVILASLGRPDLAGREFETCLRIDPNNAVARRGWASLGQGNR